MALSRAAGSRFAGSPAAIRGAAPALIQSRAEIGTTCLVKLARCGTNLHNGVQSRRQAPEVLALSASPDSGLNRLPQGRTRKPNGADIPTWAPAALSPPLPGIHDHARSALCLITPATFTHSCKERRKQRSFASCASGSFVKPEMRSNDMAWSSAAPAGSYVFRAARTATPCWLCFMNCSGAGFCLWNSSPAILTKANQASPRPFCPNSSNGLGFLIE